MNISGGNNKFNISRIVLFLAVLTSLGSVPVSSSNSNQVSICEIQGSGFSSPYEGENVIVEGVVHADMDETWREGFFIQDQDCDDENETSDGLFVYLGERIDLVTEGDGVEISGTVKEYYDLTEISTSPVSVTVKSLGNALPIAVELAPPFNNTASKSYFETLEGMRVRMKEAVTVGPTDYDDRTWVIREDLGIQRVFQDDPSGTGEIVLVDDTGLEEITPDVKVGDHILDISGVMDYVFDEYRLSLFQVPQVTVQPEVSNQRKGNPSNPNFPQFTTATFNLWNLFDTYNDPGTEDDILSSTEYQRRLYKRAVAIHVELHEPIILAVQEVETLDVLLDLLNQPEIQAEYGVVWYEGLDVRGLDTALLYQTDYVEIITSEQRQGCTDLIDGLGPDGNQNIDHPENEMTCDLDGGSGNEGNRLFSRPPLVVNASVCLNNCERQSSEAVPLKTSQVEIWIIVNHWKSKFEDTDYHQFTLLRRLEQSQFVADLFNEILSADPKANVIVLGDFNDYIDSFPIKLLEANGLSNLLINTDRNNRYTYIYQGISQVLDHVLIRMDSSLKPTFISPVHINADFPYTYKSITDSAHRSSDHDPVLAAFSNYGQDQYLPLIFLKR